MSMQSNPQLDLAFEYVCNTHKHVFLTGKAGTGKTTFLQRIKSEPVKQMVVVAPTGVAAINAGGMTIHSFFQLPFGPFFPGAPRDASTQRKFSRDKIRLIQSLDLLVIDEISMVRADLLDAVDDVLRRFKNRYQAFGGVQLLMIGDLHQLPPVVKDEEWQMLREYYSTPYFFSSRALQQSPPVSIELKHIYRQSDETFIGLLNKVRDNQLDPSVLDALNSRYVANFNPPDEDAYITLTAHNASAHAINAEKLAAISEPLQSFQAKIENDFPAYAYPADEVLELKVGAQVMFVRNDVTRDKRFYNGKIGRVTAIDDDAIYVRCPGDADTITVAPVTWENIKYTLNEQTKEVSENIIGTFTQYPLKLAWAITIHKSQGLTFDRAIIDAQAAFAHGQVYVALSRCKSFEGIVLRSRIEYSSVRTDSTVKDYTEAADKNAPDEVDLAQSKHDYQRSLMLELFNFDQVARRLELAHRALLGHQNSLLPDIFQQFGALREMTETRVLPVAVKFQAQLQGYFAQTVLPEENPDLQERIRKACGWFAEQHRDALLPACRAIALVTDNKAAREAAQEALTELQKEIFIKNAAFAACQEGFSTQRYLRVKTNAELDFQAAQRPASPANALIQTPHPGLYVKLKKWRDDVAADHGVEPYAVLPTKTLLEIVRLLPTNIALLKTVKGIGQAKSKQFGAAILELIRQYVAEKNFPHHQITLPEPPPAPPPPPKPDTKTVSLQLFRSGKTIDDIAAERGLVRGTIESHLTHFIERGELDIYDVLPRETVRDIEAFFTEFHTNSCSEARTHFGEQYSYNELRMVLRWLEGRGGVA